MKYRIEEKIRTLGLTLPEPPKALGSYLPCVIAGDLVFASGVIPIKNGKVMTGKFGIELTVKDAKEICEKAALLLLANLKNSIGSLENIERFLRIDGYINSTEDFKDQPAVLNELSNLIVQIFGENGKHSRIAIGVNTLPAGAAIEIAAIIKIKKLP